MPFAPPGELEITLAWFKAGPEVGQINLGGSLIGNGASGDQTFDKKKLTVTPAPPVAGDITLKGDIVVSKYPGAARRQGHRRSSKPRAGLASGGGKRQYSVLACLTIPNPRCCW